MSNNKDEKDEKDEGKIPNKNSKKKTPKRTPPSNNTSPLEKVEIIEGIGSEKDVLDLVIRTEHHVQKIDSGKIVSNKSTIDWLLKSLNLLTRAIKYLLFDLEATRRENAYLRKMLEEQGGEDF